MIDPKAISTPMKQEISERFKLNIARVRNLVAIYSNLVAGQGRGRRGHQTTDVLRAATVLLHASVEDVLRSLAYWKLPAAATQVLDKIPFAGGKEKITLGTLSSYRGKSVDDVIKESVYSNLDRSNYNNTVEVCSLLDCIGLNNMALQSFLPALDTAMKRRHQIVHRADSNPNPGRGNHRVASIAPQNVNDWITNTEQFVEAVLAQV